MNDAEEYKAEVLRDLYAENIAWGQLLAQVGEDRLDDPGVAGPWSMKDIVAHLTGWRRRTVGRLEAAAKNEPEPAALWPPELQTDDEINAWIYETNRDRPAAEVLADSSDVFRRLASALAALPASDFTNPQRFPWMEGEPFSGAAFFSHFHEEHEPDIRAWLARRGPGD
jgi:hypothetical protein